MPDSIPDLTLYGDGWLLGIDGATAGQLVPGLAGRQLTEDEVARLRDAALGYVANALRYRAELRVQGPSDFL